MSRVYEYFFALWRIISIDSSSGTISGNVFTNSIADTQHTAIAINNGTNPLITDNFINKWYYAALIRNSHGTFSGNTIYNGVAGLGISNSDPQIKNNVIGGFVIGISLFGGGSASISGNNIFITTDAIIASGDKTNPQITYNTITNAKETGIGVTADAPPNIINNIIAKNTGYGINTKYSKDKTDGRPMVSFNDVWGNDAGNYNGIDKPVTDTSEDPLFIDFSKNSFFLTPDSPCLKASDSGGYIGAYPLNHPPKADSLSLTTDEDTPISIYLTGSDPDGNAIYYNTINQPKNGTVGTNTPIIYKPNQSFSGTDSFTFTVTDGDTESEPGTVTITVNQVNHPPTADSQVVNLKSLDPVSIVLTGNDPDKDNLIFNVKGKPQKGSLSGKAPDLSYKPNPDFSGTDRFTFIVSDGTLESDIATVTITNGDICLKGDVNGDNKIISVDAILTLRILSGIIKPTDQQTCAADINGDGKIRANDAILILQRAAGLVAPGRNIISNAENRITITLAEAYGVAGESIIIPLNMDNIEILASGDICLIYNSSILRAVDVSSDPNMLLVSNIMESGKIHIAFASSNKLNSNTIANIRFDVLVDTESPIILKSAEPYRSDATIINSKLVNGRFQSLLMRPNYSALLQNYPNPFNPETWIPYQLSEAGKVVISIYNVSGHLVRRLDLGHKEAGMYLNREMSAYWDGKNESGDKVSSGVYFYNIQSGKFSKTMKLIVSR